MNAPMMTDGIPESRSIADFITLTSACLAYSNKKKAIIYPKGKTNNVVKPVINSEPINRASVPYPGLFSLVGYQSTLINNSAPTFVKAGAASLMMKAVSMTSMTIPEKAMVLISVVLILYFKVLVVNFLHHPFTNNPLCGRGFYIDSVAPISRMRLRNRLGQRAPVLFCSDRK